MPAHSGISSGFGVTDCIGEPLIASQNSLAMTFLNELLIWIGYFLQHLWHDLEQQ